MKKKGGGGEEGGNWMDTYGDLVTLLLTFFVLLYSMSSIDNKKWDIFVRSIYPDGMTPSEKAANSPLLNKEKVEEDSEEPTEAVLGDPELPKEEITPADVSQMYLQLAKALNQAGVEGVTISRGKDYTFVVFKDKAFFKGDSSVLTEQGQLTLDVFAKTIAPANDLISQINIMGHTSQADPNRLNNVRNDRMLSSMRAAEVSIYLQNKQIVDPEKLVSIGYGQFRPLESNATAEGRAANRRVEILLIDKDGEAVDMDKIYKEFAEGANADTTVITTGNPNTQLPEGAVSTPDSNTTVIETIPDVGTNDTTNITPADNGMPAQANAHANVQDSSVLDQASSVSVGN